MPEPKSYALASWLFLRLLGLVYLVAFVSLATQIRGLIGTAGILPAGEVLASRKRRRISRFWRRPTLCWLSTSDRFLLFLCWGGAFLACLLIAGLAPLPATILLWVFYLSLFNVSSLFLGYQWDVLLLETGFLAVFLSPVSLWPGPPTVSPSPLILGLFWWLLFRLMFSSGLVKLRSGDRSWRKLTALCYHYGTQPLPTRLAWHAHQLPPSVQKYSAAAVLLVEMAVPFLIFAPAPACYGACICFVVLMLLIELTGNYAFFNLLGLSLSLLLLDDDILRPLIGRWIQLSSEIPSVATSTPVFRWVYYVVVVVLLLASFDVLAKLFRLTPAWPKAVRRLLELLTPFHLVNSYGLFSVMTTERPEIIVEGSNDGVEWREYDFKWKPGPANRPPRFIAPHQPRLDWQMWFAAIGYCENNPWLVKFLTRLLEGAPRVVSLTRRNPFPQPPLYVRAVLYEYKFSDRAQHRATGAWWQRELRGIYCPMLSLADLSPIRAAGNPTG